MEHALTRENIAQLGGLGDAPFPFARRLPVFFFIGPPIEKSLDGRSFRNKPRFLEKTLESEVY